MWVLSLALLSGLRILRCLEVWCRSKMQRIQRRRPAATALIRPLAWEPPYATGSAVERQKDKKKEIRLVIVYILKYDLFFELSIPGLLVFFLFVFVFVFRAIAASPGHSHSHARSELRLRPTPQLTATLDP